ncbi:hypothetical protein C8J57DRAFT_1401588 [Mycena rebaudengoi]|nr:hypothetical protein C8J57DRAFT_1401588 [Mycena rebaudengoi]
MLPVSTGARHRARYRCCRSGLAGGGIMSPQRPLVELVARSLGSLLRAPRRWRGFCLPTRWRDRPCVHIFEGPPASFWFPPSPAALGPLCCAHTIAQLRGGVRVGRRLGADDGYARWNRVLWRTCRSLMPLHALSIACVREAGRSLRQVSAIVRGRLGVVPGPCTSPSMPPITSAAPSNATPHAASCQGAAWEALPLATACRQDESPPPRV